MQVQPSAFATRRLFQEFDVGACNERAAGCGDQDGLHRWILCQLFKTAEQTFVTVLTDGFNRRVVDHDQSDIRVALQFHDVVHGDRSLTYTAKSARRVWMQVDSLVAIDTHVHIEPDSRDTAADEAARQYFGESGPVFSREELAEYYRSRKIGCVVFSVDERMTGRKQVPNEADLALANDNADV